MSLVSGNSTQPSTSRLNSGTSSSSSSSTSSISASASSVSSTTSTSSTIPVNRVQPATSNLTQSSTTSQTTSSTTTSQTSTQSSVSQTSTTTSTITATTTTSVSSSTSTLTSQPVTRPQHGTLVQINTTSLVTVSSYEVPLTTQASSTSLSQSTSSTTTSEPKPTVTPTPGTAARATRRLVIDLGDCAGFASPRFLVARGDLGDLVAIGKGRYAVEMKTEEDSGIFGVVLSLKDDGTRCGNDATCTPIELTFGSTDGLFGNVLKFGDYSLEMYPFSVWLENGVTWDARSIGSPEEMYHCWGWSDEECPYSLPNSSGASWTLSSDNPTGLVYVGFCPSDGPKWSTIPKNPNPQSSEPQHEGTYIILPTQTVLSTSTFLTAITPTASATPSAEPDCDVPQTCIFPNTYISEDVTSTVRSEFITAPAGSTILFSTAIVGHTTSTVPQTTLLGKPTPTVTSWIVKSTDVEQSSVYSDWTFSTLTGGSRTRRPATTRSGVSNPPISTPLPTVVPTYSDITLGTIVSTLSYDVTVTPSPAVSSAPTTTPAPDSQYVITSWTTWMTVNGTTVPAVAGEVGVLSTIPVTYMLEPSTTIPVAEISSRSVESIRTSSPSSSVAASSDESQTKTNQGGKIAGAVVGTLVGLILGSLIIWYICYRRRRRERRDYFARGDPAWLSPSHANGSGGGSRLLVDLDEEPRMQNSYVEPWVSPRTSPQSTSRGKPSQPSQPEMLSVEGGYGVSTMAGPSREPDSSSNEGGSSWFQHESSDSHNVFAAAPTRPGKSIPRVEPRRIDMTVPQRRAPFHYRTASLANPSLSLLPTPFQNEPPSPITPPTPSSRATLVPNRVSPPPRAGPSQRRYVDEEQVRDNAIPPLYNEAWNTGQQ